MFQCDEAQDMNPPMLDIINTQLDTPTVLVGDPYQQIYSFRLLLFLLLLLAMFIIIVVVVVVAITNVKRVTFPKAFALAVVVILIHKHHSRFSRNS